MRKILAIGLILILFFTCAAVSAEEAISDDIVSVDETIDEAAAIEEDSIIEQSIEEETLSADEGTFTQLQEEVKNAEPDSTIKLEKNYTFDTGFNKSGISFENNLTIDGNGYTVNANREGRIFNIGDKNVIIKNMILINAYAEGDGGAMFGGTAINCTFINNEAEEGGAICGSSSDVAANAIDCKFYNNKATFYGGAIRDCMATNCEFDNNSAELGGAMSYGTAEKCNFTNNKAVDFGGAMHGSAINCTFINNYAETDGALSGSAINCTFINNTAYYYSGAMSGSAINCTFTNNRVVEKGGAICDGIAEKCIFTNNTAQFYGGAMYGGTAKNCTFINNFARYGGGAIYKGSGVDCTYINNTNGATSIKASSLSTVYNKNGYLIITLKDTNGKPIADKKVYIELNGEHNLKTDKNGQIKIAVGKFIPKTYTANISFAGDDYYAPSNKSVKVTVKKATPKIVAKTKTFKRNVKVKKYTITLKNNINKVIKKNKVYIKVKKKTYVAKTNNKGKATFKIKNLKKKGTYKATITYKGNKYYKKVSKKVKIKVK